MRKSVRKIVPFLTFSFNVVKSVWTISGIYPQGEALRVLLKKRCISVSPSLWTETVRQTCPSLLRSR